MLVEQKYIERLGEDICELLLAHHHFNSDCTFLDVLSEVVILYVQMLCMWSHLWDSCNLCCPSVIFKHSTLDLGSIDVYIDTMLLDFCDQRSKGYDFA